MIKVVGIRFKPAGKVYNFDAGAFVLNIGDAVIVETEQGLGFGFVAIPPVLREEDDIRVPENESHAAPEDSFLIHEEAGPCEDSEPPEPEDTGGETGPSRILKKVFRPATEQDFEQKEKNAGFEKEAHKFCMGYIREFGLKMNLFAVESTFDASKLTFFFTAEGRVDFRELVKVLVKEFHTRIEMRQVGIRNQAKICGGIGRCGRELCCAAFIEKFEPVSIRMAKEQNLSLNPTKISGLCGRLMCCLTYEYETYMRLRAEMPKLGEIVDTPKGKGRVIRQNPIRGRILIRTEDGHETEIELFSDQDASRETVSSFIAPLEKENKAELKRELNCSDDDPEEDSEDENFPEHGDESELEF